jgi:calcineurin-like phosphoesterase family protein
MAGRSPSTGAPLPRSPGWTGNLVARWNDAVGAQDEVWHLGDFAVRPRPGRVAELLDALNGTKHPVLGNNDGLATTASGGWASIQHYAEIEVEGVHLVLCHYAFRTWRTMGRGWINLPATAMGASGYSRGSSTWVSMPGHPGRPADGDHRAEVRPGKAQGVRARPLTASMVVRANQQSPGKPGRQLRPGGAPGSMTKPPDGRIRSRTAPR